MITPVPLAELLEDETIYPRARLDAQHVRDLVQAIEAGAILPPPVADSRSKRIVDGWHRVDAYRRFSGETAVINVDLREYQSKQEMLLDAMALNSAHGRKLDRKDVVRCIRMAENVGISIEKAALVLHIPEQKAQQYRVLVAKAPPGIAGTIPGSNLVVLKRGARHLVGTTLTREQVEAHSQQGGTSFLLQANQLRRALETDLVNPGDERLMEALSALRAALAGWLSRHAQSEHAG